MNFTTLEIPKISHDQEILRNFKNLNSLGITKDHLARCKNTFLNVNLKKFPIFESRKIKEEIKIENAIQEKKLKSKNSAILDLKYEDEIRQQFLINTYAKRSESKREKYFSHLRADLE